MIDFSLTEQYLNDARQDLRDDTTFPIDLANQIYLDVIGHIFIEDKSGTTFPLLPQKSDLETHLEEIYGNNTNDLDFVDKFSLIFDDIFYASGFGTLFSTTKFDVSRIVQSFWTNPDRSETEPEDNIIGLLKEYAMSVLGGIIN